MKCAAIRLLLTVSVLFMCGGCASLPRTPGKAVVQHEPPATAGMLASWSDTVLAGAQAEESAFQLLVNNAEALNWRLALIDSATTSIDLQVFIWSADECGRLLLSRLMAAAERGVKVRLLIDDFPGEFSDRGMYLVTQVPNMSLRNFNPQRYRNGLISGSLEMGLAFGTLNKRMHNKQMLVDGRWAIVGGRNIGNPYFGFSKKYNFRDLDVLVTGPVMRELAAAFDKYWNCDVAYPGEMLRKDGLSERKKRKAYQAFYGAVGVDRWLFHEAGVAALPRDWAASFEPLPQTMHRGVGVFLHDAPVVRGDRGQRLSDQLREFTGGHARDTVVISPYLIPSEEALQNGAENIAEGGSMTVITAAMDSNNHTMANSHYKKYRKTLLEAGARLYEFSGQPGPRMRQLTDTPPVESGFVSLHMKAFEQDSRWVYIGSLNLDPRAQKINTEDILAIDSPPLAEALLAEVAEMLKPENAWHVTLNEKQKVRWVAGQEVRKHQPARGFGQRCADWFFRLLPIESQL